MSVFVAMLRGINVGGQKMMRMETLRGICDELGFSNIRTYVQSGNVVFESWEKDRTGLAKKTETHIEQTLGLPVAVFIRQTDELQRILAGNPFLKGRNEDPSKLHVTFLYQSPSDAAWSNLKVPVNSSDEFAPGEQVVYLFCPNGYGKTKLSNSFFERRLSMPATTRNWNTVNALYNMAMEK